MKIKFGILALSVTLLASCDTVMKTAHTADVNTSVVSATVADIVPATEGRITHTLRPNESIRRGGMDNIRQAVISEALEKHNADVLIEPQYVITKEKKLFGSKITSITVSGRPGNYTNFRALPDSVWNNPVFRGIGRDIERPVYTPAEKPGSWLAGGMLGKLGSKPRTKSSNVNAFRSKGLAMSITPFIGYGEFDCEHVSMDGTALAAFFSLGYQFNPYFYLGAGIGINGMNGDYHPDGPANHPKLSGTYMPIFANARINFSKKRNTLFLDYKTGYGTGGNTDVVGGGFFIAGAIGYSFGNLDVAFQIITHECNFDYEYYQSNYWGGYWETQNDYNAFLQYGLSVGYHF